MGGLADLILGNLEDAPAIVASDYPLASFHGVNADGLDPLMLAALHALLAAKDATSLMSSYRPMAEASNQGPWLIRFPQELIHLVADLPPQDHAMAASRWAATERLQREGWADLDAEQMLERIVYVAQTAALEKREAFLCVYG